MARRDNSLFIGKEYMNVEGRSIKHPALIKLYASLNVNKIKEKPIDVIGLDIETNHKTGELKLLGFWNGDDYANYTKNHLKHFLSIIRWCFDKNKAIAYWNKLDPFILFKQFLYFLKPDAREKSMERFGKISGEWNRKTKEWDLPPIVEIKMGDKLYGIRNVIRSSIQFYYRTTREGLDPDPKTIWAYDIAQLYPGGLEKEAESRLDYYSKLGKSAHLVNWSRFEKDSDYRNNMVLKSNELDSRAVYDLAYIIQNEFKKAFDWFPNTLVSQGSLARSAIVSRVHDKYERLYGSDDELSGVKKREKRNRFVSDIRSIGITEHIDRWYHDGNLQDFYALTAEAYSGGYIESLMYGMADDAYYADLASAYPAVIMQLYDLRGSKIRRGTGKPPMRDYCYYFIRGTVDVPDGIDIHPITVKHPLNKDTNIRATGIYRAAYLGCEREFGKKHGITFTDETWYEIETKGKLSPLAEITKEFIDLRAKLKKEGNSAEWMAKIAANSLYGVLFEAVDTYEIETQMKEFVVEEKVENPYREMLKKYRKNINLDDIANGLKYHFGNDYTKIRAMWHDKNGLQPDVVAQELKESGVDIPHTHGADIMIWINDQYREKRDDQKTEMIVVEDIIRAGYRAGEFFNSVYASIITARTRTKISDAAWCIRDHGGKIALIMTDALFWLGSADMLDDSFIREKKTVGYFEKPRHIKNFVCLGSGRYSYHDDNGKVTAKKRGLRATDFHNPDGIMLSGFDWENALKLMRHQNSIKLDVNVRMLISVGIVLNNHEFTFEDLGLIIEAQRNIDVIVGKTKRFYSNALKNPQKLSESMVETQPIHLLQGMQGKDEIPDRTYPILRNRITLKKFKTLDARQKESQRRSSRKWNKKHRQKKNDDYKEKYQFLRDEDYTTKEAKKMASWSWTNINHRMNDDERGNIE